MSAVPYALAADINERINAGTRYRTDLELYQRLEHWEPAAGEGDCEDYALAKRAALLEAKADPARLRLATCWIGGEHHAVLIVTTDRGDYVLDNRHAEPMTRQALECLGYRWHLIQEGPQWQPVA